jgi:CBS-domain-containing membrane protein
MRQFLARHQPAPRLRTILLAGLGASAAIGVLTLATHATPWLLLIAPFGATCALLFGAPGSPLAQPSAVIGGHVVATLTALALHAILPNAWWAPAVAVGAAIALMMALRVLHPPGAADPIIVFALDAKLSFLFAPILVGAAALVAMATLWHRLSGTTYPTPKA